MKRSRVSVEAGITERTTWIDFWSQDQFWTYPELFKLNAEIILEATENVIGLSPSDDVINIGGGPGFLEEIMAPKVRSVFLADPSKPFVEEARRRCQNHLNFQAEGLPENYYKVDSFGRKFSLFLCVSVIQYYRSIHEVEQLISAARNVALPHAKMLIADMPREDNWTHFFSDAFKSLHFSLKRGHAGLLLRKAWKERSKIAHYRKISKQQDHLYLTESNFDEIAEKLSVKISNIRNPFSISPNRLNFLIEF